VFGDLLDIVSLHDLFEPLTAFFNDLRGPSEFIIIPSMAGWSKREVRQLLEQYRVDVWGDMYDGDIMFVSVPAAEARWAHQVLTTAGVPVVSPMPQPRRGILSPLREV